MAAARIRELELCAIADPKKTNLIVDIMQSLNSSSLQEKLTSIHSLRRIFIEILESKRLINKSYNNLNNNDEDNSLQLDLKMKEYRKWVLSNLFLYQKTLNDFIIKGDLKVQTAAVRTILEFVKREYLYQDVERGIPYTGSSSSSSMNEAITKSFGLRTYEYLIKALLHSEQIDVDLLLMIRSEVFSKYDCSFYALHIIRNEMKRMKTESKKQYHSNNQTNSIPGHIVTNCLDLLRVLAVPTANIPTGIGMTKINNNDSLYTLSSTGATATEFQVNNFLILPSDTATIMKKNSQNEDDSDDDDDNSDDDDDDDQDYAAKAVIDDDKVHDHNNNHNSSSSSGGNSRYHSQKRKQPSAESIALLQSLSSVGKKKFKIDTTNNSNNSKNTKNTRLSLSQKLLSIKQHKKEFSKAWLLLLSCTNLTLSQHKLILKHLSEHLMNNFNQPLLLADYLTQCYTYGSILAVLALESLFELIIHRNLDYPRFFESLYALCTPEIFSAKYRSKFMKLLSMSLRSTNLPVYMVASFIKRLARLALTTPASSSLYCVAQITWLLREHPECSVLLHREDQKNKNSTNNGDKKSSIIATPNVDFDNKQQDDIQLTNALSSSLWEIEALRTHYCCLVSDMASALENPASTMKPTSLHALAKASDGQSASGTKAGGGGAAPINMMDFIDQSYESMMEGELKKTGSKKRASAALSHQPPTGLWTAANSVVGKHFGVIHHTNK